MNQLWLVCCALGDINLGNEVINLTIFMVGDRGLVNVMTNKLKQGRTGKEF